MATPFQRKLPRRLRPLREGFRSLGSGTSRGVGAVPGEESLEESVGVFKSLHESLGVSKSL